MELKVYIGFDTREAACFAVCRNSIRRRLNVPYGIRGIVKSFLEIDELYTRETQRRSKVNDSWEEDPKGQLYDVISDAPMSTEFAISRFLTPHLAQSGWALFMDCDIMARENVANILEFADSSKAVMCVKHEYDPPEDVKMDGQAQLRYRRKNWSSVMLFNCNHPSNAALTPELINSLPGRDLHGFCWLQDDEIGELPKRWNYLVGHTKLEEDDEPALVHWTTGAPCFAGLENVEYAGEFWDELHRWAL